MGSKKQYDEVESLKLKPLDSVSSFMGNSDVQKIVEIYEKNDADGGGLSLC